MGIIVAYFFIVGVYLWLLIGVLEYFGIFNKFTMRIIGSISFLFVVIGFFMHIFSNQSGFDLAKLLHDMYIYKLNYIKISNLDSLAMVAEIYNLFPITIILCIFFIVSLLGLLLFIPIIINKKLSICFDWIPIIIDICCFIYLIIFVKIGLKDILYNINSILFSSGNTTSQSLQTGGYFIIIGFFHSLISIGIASTFQIFENRNVNIYVKDNMEQKEVFKMKKTILKTSAYIKSVTLIFCFVAVFFFLMPSALFAQTPAPERDFRYELTKDGQGICITAYTGKNPNLVIPKTIEGYPVKEIQSKGDWWAMNIIIKSNEWDSNGWDTYKLVTLVIPEGVEIIGIGAFEKNTSLRKVVLSNTVHTIAGFAFEGCSSLTEINIPTGIRVIGNYAFKDCGELYELRIPDSINSININVIDGWGVSTFKGCGKLRLATRKRLEELGYKGSY